LDENSHPYVVFLPVEHKTRILSAIFGSRAAVDILKFSLKQGISNKIYQKDLMKKLTFSNKTIIENLKSLTKLRVLDENMEKAEENRRVIWVKTYRLTDSGRWFALLMAQEKDLTEDEKAGILQDLFRTYVRWVKNLSDKLHVDKTELVGIFEEEMK
jgi:DNA-binding PadR family transcriptional regulator